MENHKEHLRPPVQDHSLAGRNTTYRTQSLEFTQRGAFGSLSLSVPSYSKWIIGVTLLTIIAFVTLLLSGMYAEHETIDGSLAFREGEVAVKAHQAAVVAELYVKAGEHVAKGQPVALLQVQRRDASGADLFEINDVSLGSQLDDLREQSKRVDAIMNERIKENLEVLQSLEQRVAINERKAHVSRLLLAEQIRINQDMQVLGDIAAVSRLEYQNQVEKKANLELSLLAADEKRLALALEKKAIESDMRRYRQEAQNEQMAIRKQLFELQRERATNAQQRSYSLLASREGEVISMPVKVGQFLDAKDTVVTLAAAQDLEVNLFASDRAVARLQIGDRIKVDYEAFPYQRYGRFPATVTYVSNSVTKNAEGNGKYKVVAELDKQYVTSGKEHIPLKSGYKVQAKIVMDKRSLANWLLFPLATVGDRLVNN